MFKVMTLEQESMMRNLTGVGVSIAKARAFAINAQGEPYLQMKEQFKKLNDLFCKLDLALPEDSEVDVTQSDVYRAEVTSTLKMFNPIYSACISDAQFKEAQGFVDRLLESCI